MPGSSALISLSSAKLSPQTPPRASARHSRKYSRDVRRSPAASPALSSASTADGEASPDLPPLPAPVLPQSVLGLLRTPPDNQEEAEGSGAAESNDNPWGSPYPFDLRREGSSNLSDISDSDDDSPIHRLELPTRFLRPAPPAQDSPLEVHLPRISAAAAVLANRARRIAHGITEGITEGWIRQHTAGGAEQEKRHWFSDGESEHSSLSDSISAEEAAWLGDDRIQTPRVGRRKVSGRSRGTSRGTVTKQSSNETLRPSQPGWGRESSSTMATVPDDRALMPNGDGPSVADPLARPRTPSTHRDATLEAPVTPSRAAAKKAPTAATPRVKKKVPWKGKSVMVLLPRDDERGQPGRPPMPLTEKEVEGMLRSWQQLGYNIDGFDMCEPPSEFGLSLDPSQSKGAWPDPEDMAKERQARNWKVLLPDLDAWKKYVDELNEAKLRALGVSFGDEDPPPPSISPVSSLSRQASIAPYPPLPFSPPIPTSSASSNHAIPGFSFPNPFVTSSTQSPSIPAPGIPAGIPAGTPPVPFGVKFNPRASISISSPHGLPHLLLQQQGHRAGSPSLANLSAIMSPASPFSDGMPPLAGHQRHQSLQFPTLPHQFPPPVRASPRLQELREVDEEAVVDNAPPPRHEPGFISHNASDSLQKEIDEAEYHLEEQMRSTLDNDQDYSPHNDHLAPQQHRFTGDADGVVLHHPRPHSRGHSLSQKYFTEDDASKQKPFRPTLQQINAQPTEDDEIETNPSNLGTPVQPLDLSTLMHQRGFSTVASNPWLDSEPSQPPVPALHQAGPNHGSSSSFSKFNVEAPEFKFNPTSTFKPGGFSFTSNTFQPAAFNAAVNSFEPSPSAVPSATSSKINVNAPVFSPGQSEFSFSASGPKFRPDAPSFTPNSYATSVTSPPMSAAESGSNRTSSIFGNIDLNAIDAAKSAKKSKAIPIVPPPKELRNEGESLDADGHLAVDESRIKRVRGKADDDGDTVPLFAEPTKDDTPVPGTRAEDRVVEDAVPAEEKSFDESHLGLDMTMSSTMVSETTDTKATVSPSVPSPKQSPTNWAPFELKDNLEVQAFNDARPFTDTFKPSHKKSLSATAKVFVPGAAWVSPVDETAPATETPADEPADKVSEESGAAVEETPAVKDDMVPAVDVAPPTETDSAPELESKTTEEEPAPVPAVEAPIIPGSRGLAASRFASPPQQPPEPKRSGLAASRFAAPASPSANGEESPAEQPASPHQEDDAAVSREEPVASGLAAEPTMDDIDEVMRCLDENPDMGVNRTYDDPPQWRESTPPMHQAPFDSVAGSSPSRLHPPTYSRSDAPSPSQAGDYLEDPFIDPPRSGQSVEGAVRRLNETESVPSSDWDGAFSEDEKTKFESRLSFFDGRVNELVGNLLAARLHPLERSLDNLHHALSGIAKRPTSSRHELASVSAAGRDSDADDEDDEIPPAMRSISPRRDRRMEQIRAAVLDALTAHRRNQSKDLSTPAQPPDHSVVLKALEDMREQLGQSLQPSVRHEDIRSIVEEVVERRVPPPPSTTDKDEKLAELQSRIADLEQRLQAAEAHAAAEAAAKNEAEKRAAESDRELQTAATRIEVEMMNRSAQSQRIADLEDRVHHAEQQAEEEVKTRRAAEDRLSEVQRLLRISSEEETRLRELVDEKNQTLREIEAAQTKSAMRIAHLEAKETESQQSQSRISALESEAQEARQEAERWRSETDRLVAILYTRDRDLKEVRGDLKEVRDENKALHKLIDTLSTQLQENERVRDTWRSKFLSMQEEMAQAAKQITEENARHIKKEQALLARQEVLEARLQAEARTRERIETELQRLEMGERQGMRAVAECKRLEGALAEMRAENHKLHQAALRYQAEFQEARESGAREVQRTRDAMQAEVDNANHQVNLVREQLEDEVSRLRAQLDQVRLDADTARARHEMLLEEAQNSKRVELEALMRKHHNEMEDMQARYERQINNTTEDAQRAEQNLLERLSISTSKSEYLQDKVAHLEEKLEIAKEAARAAAQAAKSAAGSEPAFVPQPAKSRQLDLPEKISPQALRESIMVLQEQLQEREQRIEDLETKLAKADPEAETKIAKRDDEITWLRELLAVRHSDLQDIITALNHDDFDRAAVRDAAIRLKANLQMEEQERERAMNGGSAITLPNIAATIRDAATPRVAQAVGPLAAALGSWRRAARERGSTVLSSPAPSASNNSNGARNSTPSRIRPAATAAAASSFLGGLLTPPASSAQTKHQPQQQQQQPPQPTAFASTGRRFTPQDLANRPRAPSGMASTSSSAKGKAPMATSALATDAADAPEAPQTPLQEKAPLLRSNGPVTPPMMRPSVYDDDAQVEDFDDTGFFED
ncbi:hypothetical protein VTJ83DRAFT_1708 [Remersonia thermophila]|uniref:Myosin class II heavy chain n=1 Tax=Remersonia thermophila TaxID=72144 RepID=A0ABR4DHL2_9PEZI